MRCETCGNDYDRPMMIRIEGQEGEHAFDSFECAIHALAPRCQHCGCTIVGHGVESDHLMYCCAHCARESGHEGAVDNLERVAH